MRRLVMLLGMVMLIAMVAAGVALAVTKVCKDVPCEGTDRDDVLFERIGNREHDRIFGFEGRDVINANTYDSDRDVLHGDASRDRLLTNDTDNRDRADGGRGRDTCYVSQGDTTRSCEVVRRATFSAGTSDVAQDSSDAAFAEGQ
jgi:RTX calcium-binding nonapeptide repeat (4 copies)